MEFDLRNIAIRYRKNDIVCSTCSYNYYFKQMLDDKKYVSYYSGLIYSDIGKYYCAIDLSFKCSTISFHGRILTLQDIISKQDIFYIVNKLEAPQYAELCC